MTAIKIPQEPFEIEGVMDELGRQLTEQEAKERAEPRLEQGEAAIDHARRLIEVERARDITPSLSISSHRKILGGIVSAVKRFLHWGTRAYTDNLAENQRRFNEAALDFDRLTSGRLDTLDKQRADAAERLGALDESQAKSTESQSGINQEIRDSIALLQQRGQERDARMELAIANFEGQIALIDGRVESLFARHDLGPFFDSLSEEARAELGDVLRGPYGEIRGRHHKYVELFRGRPGQILDVGCGRGEFLDVMRAEGIEAWGCEIESEMIAQCEKRDLLVRPLDALNALESVAKASLGGVFSSQVIEHLFPGDLLSFIRLAREKIAPGGILTLETLNPQSLAVLAKSYYKDLDHKKAIDPNYLARLLEAIGFEQVEARRAMPFGDEDRLAALDSAEALGITTEAHAALTRVIDKLNAAIWAEQDYYVTAVVPGGEAVDGGRANSLDS